MAWGGRAHPDSLPAWLLLQAIRRDLRLPAPLGAGGAVPAAAGRDPATPAGLPVPRQVSRGAAAQRGWPHRGPRDSAAGMHPRWDSPWAKGAWPGRGVPAVGRPPPLQPLPPPRQVVRVYCYVAVVSLQYLTPVILTLHCTLLLKTLGEELAGKRAGPAERGWGQVWSSGAFR